MRHNRTVAYDVELADRIRELLVSEPGHTEQAMFGGLAFLVGGHMALAASGQGGIMVRVDPAETDVLVGQPHVTRMVMSGREMDGWVRVEAAGIATDDDLAPWVRRGADFVASLPGKP